MSDWSEHRIAVESWLRKFDDHILRAQGDLATCCLDSAILELVKARDRIRSDLLRASIKSAA